jgi:hypothetical protein
MNKSSNGPEIKDEAGQMKNFLFLIKILTLTGFRSFEMTGEIFVRIFPDDYFYSQWGLMPRPEGRGGSFFEYRR